MPERVRREEAGRREETAEDEKIVEEVALRLIKFNRYNDRVYLFLKLNIHVKFIAISFFYFVRGVQIR